jgi:hypothetical protein
MQARIATIRPAVADGRGPRRGWADGVGDLWDHEPRQGASRRRRRSSWPRRARRSAAPLGASRPAAWEPASLGPWPRGLAAHRRVDPNNRLVGSGVSWPGPTPRRALMQCRWHWLPGKQPFGWPSLGSGRPLPRLVIPEIAYPVRPPSPRPAAIGDSRSYCRNARLHWLQCAIFTGAELSQRVIRPSEQKDAISKAYNRCAEFIARVWLCLPAALRHAAVVGADHLPQFFRVEPRRKRRRANEIAEHHS